MELAESRNRSRSHREQNLPLSLSGLRVHYISTWAWTRGSVYKLRADIHMVQLCSKLWGWTAEIKNWSRWSFPNGSWWDSQRTEQIGNRFKKMSFSHKYSIIIQQSKWLFKAGLTGCACDSNTWEAKPGWWPRVRGQPGQLKETKMEAHLGAGPQDPPVGNCLVDNS